jgi:hypothetical protein
MRAGTTPDVERDKKIKNPERDIMNPSHPAGNNTPGKDIYPDWPAIPGTQKKSSPPGGSSVIPEGSPASALANRMTGLRAQATLPRRTPRNVIRRYTHDDLNERDAEIPYLKTERAIRDFVCSILERQDRMNEEIFCRMIDLEYRIDDLEIVRDFPTTGKRSLNPKVKA